MINRYNYNLIKTNNRIQNMSQFIKEFGIIDEEIVTSIINTVKNDTGILSTSEMYDSNEETIVIDLEKRSSKFKTIVDDSLFKLFDQLILRLNKIDRCNNYSVVKNDI